MTTTYILSGGNDLGDRSYGEDLSKLILTIKQRPTILSCFFATSKEDVEEKRPRWDEWFSEFFEGSKIIRGELDAFYSQAQEADVIYLHGGPHNNLIELLPDVAKFEDAVTGKIVVGSSAGANYLSSGYYRRSQDVVAKGSAIVPLPVLVHYGITEWRRDVYEPDFWQKAKERVQVKTGSNTVLCLPESTFSVFQK